MGVDFKMAELKGIELFVIFNPDTRVFVVMLIEIGYPGGFIFNQTHPLM